MSARTVHVAVAVIRDEAGRVLVTQRLPHQHLAGFWEFPGGKLEPGETLAAGMRREIHEELGIVVEQLVPLLRVEHRYCEKGHPEKTVLLDVWRITRWSGALVDWPVGREGQPLRWLHPDDMLPAEFPAADVPIIAALRLPTHYLISPDIKTPTQLDAFVARVVGANLPLNRILVQVRLDAMPMLAPSLIAALRVAVPQARILINSRTLAAVASAHSNDAQHELPSASLCGADGIHLTAQDLRGCTAKPSAFAAASCHDADELRLAYALSLDFATLSPVLATASHPDAAPLGWPLFAERVRDAGLPVFALGGMYRADLPQALLAGAVGVAGISGLLDDRCDTTASSPDNADAAV